MLQDSIGWRKNSRFPPPRRPEGSSAMALLRTATPSDLGPLCKSDRVFLRRPRISDYPAWAELRAASRDFLPPWDPLWANDELSRASFRRRVRHYLRDLREDVGYALFIFAAMSGSLV